MSVYEYKAVSIDGEEVNLDQYKGKVLLVVNTASKCGFTPQYEELQKLYSEYKDQGLEVLGFPCNQFLGQEPGSSEEIVGFCQLNYGVDFPLFEKVDVNGDDAHPLFNYLKEEKPFGGLDVTTEGGKMLQGFLSENQPELLENGNIAWNFTKFLIDREGKVIDRFESPVAPLSLKKEIEELL